MLLIPTHPPLGALEKRTSNFIAISRHAVSTKALSTD